MLIKHNLLKLKSIFNLFQTIGMQHNKIFFCDIHCYAFIGHHTRLMDVFRLEDCHTHFIWMIIGKLMDISETVRCPHVL